MRIHYVLDDSAARLPLAIRSSEGVWDRAAELRSSAGVQLVELTTQHLQGTGVTLVDELAHYFDHGAPSDADPYRLADCFANRTALEDLLRDVREAYPGLVALHEVTELFPLDFARDLHFTLALTVVGYPAFGYVRTYADSESESYYGLVVNLAQARPHIEQMIGHFSLEALINVIRHGFFNHEGFLLAYAAYCAEIGRVPERPVDRARDELMRRGIAWYLSYRHDFAFYDQLLGLNADALANYVDQCNALLEGVNKKRMPEALEELFENQENGTPALRCLDMAGYLAARSIAQAHGDEALHEAVARGPLHFIQLYNRLGLPSPKITI